MPSRARNALFAVLSVVIGFLAPLAVAEIALRFLPVATGLATQSVNSRDPYLHFKPNQLFVYSNGWTLRMANRGRVNNYGYVNAANYDPQARTPLVAVVGDSYVEAQMVPFPETLMGRLAQRVGEQGRVYSFGASGAPLSQYLAWAEFARDTFRPDLLVVTVVGNDFDGSFYAVTLKDGFHYFVERPDGTPALERVDFERTPRRDLVRSSALARYLIGNLGLLERWARFAGARKAGRDGAAERFVGNTRASYDDAMIARSESVIDAFLQRLPEMAGLPPRRIVLVVDGIRPELYGGEADLAAVADSYFARMRQRLLAEASSRGFESIDLQPLFVARHQASGERFEFEQDRHWSGLGHEVAAEAVARTQAFRTVFGRIGVSLPIRFAPPSVVDRGTAERRARGAEHG